MIKVIIVGKVIDMTGWVMKEHGVPDSKLTVVNRVNNAKNRQARWLVKCECGSDAFECDGRDVRSGNTKSCGCLQKEKVSKINKNYNKYDSEIYSDENGEYRIGYCNNTGSRFYIDAEDYALLKNICFCECINSKDGYSYLSGRDIKTGKNKKLCYFIKYKWYDGDDSKVCEHADRNPLNNRGYNLIAATQAQNVQNQSKRIDNTSGITGVYLMKDTQKWRAQIGKNNKYIHLGIFDSKEDAIKARLKAEKKYFDDGFETNRELYEQYGIQ